MRDLQLAYFRSGVSHIDTPQDHAFFTMYKFAAEHKIKYILMVEITQLSVYAIPGMDVVSDRLNSVNGHTQEIWNCTFEEVSSDEYIVAQSLFAIYQGY